MKLRMTVLKQMMLYTGFMILIVAVPFADGEIFPREKNRTLRIVYSGGLQGKIEPCG